MVVRAIAKRPTYMNGRRRFRRRAVIRKKPTTYGLAKRMNTLQKRVNLNSKLAYGHIQRNLQSGDSYVTPTSSYPVAFQATNFATGSTNAPIYQIDTAGNISAAAAWQHYDIINTGYWTNQNLDIPDTGCYRALYANYLFTVGGNPSVDDTFVRFDFVQPRPQSFRNATSTTQALVLPQSLNALGGLATGHNMLNPTYFKLIASKTVYLNSATEISDSGTGHTNTTGNTKLVKFMLKINRNIYQSKSGTNFNYQNTSYANQIWCIISTNDKVSTFGDAINVYCTRHVCWRDTKGSSSL